MNNKSVITVLLFTIIGFLIALYALLMQVFGIDSSDKSTIISGILSMVGGIIGALGAYFIARWQMTNLLDLQYKREHKKMILEIRINKYQEMIYFLNYIKKEFNIFKLKIYSHNAYTKHLFPEYEDFKNFFRVYSLKQCDEIEELLKRLSDNYDEIFKYKVLLDEDTLGQLYLFRDSLKLFNVPLSDYLLFLFTEDEETIEEVQNKWFKEKEKIEAKVVDLEVQIKMQLESLETKLNNYIV